MSKDPSKKGTIHELDNQNIGEFRELESKQVETKSKKDWLNAHERGTIYGFLICLAIAATFVLPPAGIVIAGITALFGVVDAVVSNVRKHKFTVETDELGLPATTKQPEKEVEKGKELQKNHEGPSTSQDKEQSFQMSGTAPETKEPILPSSKTSAPEKTEHTVPETSTKPGIMPKELQEAIKAGITLRKVGTTPDNGKNSTAKPAPKPKEPGQEASTPGK